MLKILLIFLFLLGEYGLLLSYADYDPEPEIIDDPNPVTEGPFIKLKNQDQFSGILKSANNQQLLWQHPQIISPITLPWSIVEVIQFPENTEYANDPMASFRIVLNDYSQLNVKMISLSDQLLEFEIPQVGRFKCTTDVVSKIESNHNNNLRITAYDERFNDWRGQISHSQSSGKFIYSNYATRIVPKCPNTFSVHFKIKKVNAVNSTIELRSQYSEHLVKIGLTKSKSYITDSGYEQYVHKFPKAYHKDNMLIKVSFYVNQENKVIHVFFDDKIIKTIPYHGQLKINEVFFTGYLYDFYISHWNGILNKNNVEEIKDSLIILHNGNQIVTKALSLENNVCSINSEYGTLKIPISEIESFYIKSKTENYPTIDPDENLFMVDCGSFQLNIKIDSIENGKLKGTHYILGKVIIPLKLIERIFIYGNDNQSSFIEK